MDACDLRMFQRCEQSCKELDLVLKIQGCLFALETSKGDFLGTFETLNSMYHYLLGFECGKGIGKAILGN